MPYEYSVPGGMSFPPIHQIRKLLTQAESNDERIRDTRPITYLGRRAIQRNPRIRGYVRVRRTALTSFDWRIVPLDSTDTELSNAATARNMATINAIINDHTRTPIYGCRLIRLQSQFVNGENVLSVGNPLPVTAVQTGTTDNELVVMEDTYNLNIVERISSNSVEYAGSLDILEFQNHDEGSACGSILLYEAVRLAALADWANLSRLLKGLVHVVDGGSTEDESVEAQSAAQNAQDGRWVTTSDSIEFKFAKLAEAAGGTSINQFIDYLESSIAIDILGQANTTELPSNGGSRAALQEQKKISDDITFDDMRRVEGTISRLLAIDWRLNYGDRPIPYIFRFNAYESQNYESNSIVIREALNAGIPLLTDEIYNRLGFTRPPGLEDVFTSATGGI